jgi:hypothetical protein
MIASLGLSPLWVTYVLVILLHIQIMNMLQLLYAFDDSVWGMKITILEESADFATLDTENYLANWNLINCVGSIIQIMMLLSLVKLWLLVLVLVVMMLTPPPLSHLI